MFRNRPRGRCRHAIILVPEPTARSAVPGVSPGRGLLTPLGRKRSQKSINNRRRMGVMGVSLISKIQRMTVVEVVWFENPSKNMIENLKTYFDS